MNAEISDSSSSNSEFEEEKKDKKHRKKKKPIIVFEKESSRESSSSEEEIRVADGSRDSEIEMMVSSAPNSNPNIGDIKVALPEGS